MKIEIGLDFVEVDNIDLIKDYLIKGDNWMIEIYRESTTKGTKRVGIWLSHANREIPCTIMFDVSKKEALFLSKSLSAIAKSL